MGGWFILILVLGYFALLIAISFLTGKSDDHQAFFLGNRRSPWYVVAFGMIGASLSGVTFISVPGWVGDSQFAYLQMVLGYILGYQVIIHFLLPLYYRLQLTSIYSYLQQRFGESSYRTGAVFFMISRVIGAAFRLYLVAIVLQKSVFDALQVPFYATVALTIILIWVYTFRSGIKTIIWTDTLQTAFMLAAAILTVVMIGKQMLPDTSVWDYVMNSERSQIFFWDNPGSPQFFWKQFLAGAFITIVMTGLDQDMMQKNLSCRNLRDAQKNMFWLSLALVVVNLLFLSLGVLLYDYAGQNGISATNDQLFGAVALSGAFGWAVAVFFVIGLIAAAYSSADSALTALTTSFCVDILNIQERAAGKLLRKWIHFGFSLLLMVVIIIFKYQVTESVIQELFTIAGYTYGPLLGLYAFGLFTRLQIKDRWVPLVALSAPILSYLIKAWAYRYWDYQIGFELLILNGLLSFIGLALLLKRSSPGQENSKL